MSMNASGSKIVIGIVASFLSFLGWNTGTSTLPSPVATSSPHISREFTATTTNLKELLHNNIFDILTEANKNNPKSTSTPPSKKSETQKPSTKTIPKTPVIALPQIPKTTSTATTSTPHITPIQTPPLSYPLSPTFSFNPGESVEDHIKNSVVNIYCTRTVPQGLERVTGSAVAIDPSGVYLTNAHVALYILLEETESSKQTSCFIRGGSPASKLYKADIVYFPRSWANRNHSFLENVSPTGDGQKDYAIIRATGAVTQGASTQNISYMNLDETSTLHVGDTAYLAGYPANFSDGSLLDSSLYKILQKINITDSLSFNESGDAYATSPTSLAYHGSSGGALANISGSLVGIMVATTVDSFSGQTNIRAISLPYIEHDITAESGHTLEWYKTNAASEAANFKVSSAATIAQIIR